MVVQSSNLIDFIIDDDLSEEITKDSWHVNSKGYVLRNKDLKKLHRLIMDAKNGEKIDHKDRNPLNNTRSNLRIATTNQSIHNQGKRANTINNFKGVKFNSKTKLYEARCRMNFGDVHLGSFVSEIAAAHAYNKKALEISDFACPNNLDYSIEYLDSILMSDRRLPDMAENVSKYPNVYWHKKQPRGKSGKWSTFIRIGKCKIFLGRYLKDIDAYNAWCLADKNRHLFTGDKKSFTDLLNIKTTKVNYKLTDQKVLAIRRLHKINPQFNKGLIAFKLKIHRATINSIIARRIWDHI